MALFFADRVITKIVGQTKPDLVLKKSDLELIRETFRASGGKWFNVVQGDLDHIRLLKETAKVWIENHATD